MESGEEHRIIEQLYKLVSRPTSYDEFMLSLQQRLDALPSQFDDDPGVGELLGGHMARAAELVDIVTPWRHGGDDELHSLLTMKMQATMALDETGRIVDSNEAAKTLYDLPVLATLGDLPIDACAQGRLLSVIGNIISGRSSDNAPNDVIRHQDRTTRRSIVMTIEPYVVGTSEQTVAIVKTSDIGWPSHLSAILRDAFVLTRAEVDVLRLMVEGERVGDIAARRCTSIATVRSQLRSIFAKTGSATQMECVRMVFGVSLLHDAAEGRRVAERIPAACDTPLCPREDQRALHRLPGGRQIDYSVFGAENGKPLLFYHCQTWGDVWFREAVDAASEAGFRIIAPLRPGFGRTSMYTGEVSDPRQFAREMRCLLDDLDIDRAPLISVGAGLVHALAAAELMPDRLASITAAHPWLPVLCNEDYEGFNGFNKLIAHTRLHFPQGLRFLVKAGFAYVSRAGSEAFARALLRDSPKDVAWVTRPDILPICEHGLRTHRYQGYLGGYGDIAYREDWRDLLIDCPVPVRFVVGEDDRNVQLRSARAFSERLEHVSLHVLPDSGYLVHHQHAEQILRWVQRDVEVPEAA